MTGPQNELKTAPVSPAQAADEKPAAVPVTNPYNGVSSGGITLPPYYRPTPTLKSNNVYYPGQEEIGPDEMRISFIGSTPTRSPVRRPAHDGVDGASLREVFERCREAARKPDIRALC